MNVSIIRNISSDVDRPFVGNFVMLVSDRSLNIKSQKKMKREREKEKTGHFKIRLDICTGKKTTTITKL